MDSCGECGEGSVASCGEGSVDSCGECGVGSVDSDTHHHPDAVLLPPRPHLQTVVHHQVHEGVKAPQDALDVSASVQLH